MPTKPASNASLASLRPGSPTTFLLVFAVCGWLVLIANMLGLAGRAGWIFPVVDDIPGLAASTLLLLVLAMTPRAFAHLFRGKGRS